MGTPKRVCHKGGKQHLLFGGVASKISHAWQDFGGAPSDDVNSENIYHTT